MSDVPTPSAVALTADLRRRANAAIEANKILLPATHREAEDHARQVEYERRAQEPPPRQQLRDAHAERITAQGEVVRLEAALERARTHLARSNETLF